MALEIRDRKCVFRTNLDTGGGDPTFEIKRVRAKEKLSDPFEITLDLVSAEEDVDYEQLLAMPASLEMPLPGGERRHFHGVLVHLEKLGRYGDQELARTGYRAIVVPWLWTLKLTRDCRVFEGKTVKAIAEEIFAKYEYGDFEFPAGYEGPVLDHCVQYRESDFDFLSRLFEHWGLGYTFRQDDEKHQLVIFEDSAGLNEVMGDDLEATFEGKGGEGAAGTVQEFADRQKLPPAYYELLDFRFKDPDYEYKGWDWASRSMADINYEEFDYPGGYVTELDGETEGRGGDLAIYRRQAREALDRRLEGKGVATGFAAGLHFKLTFHPRQPEDTRLLLTEVEHLIEQAVGSERDPTVYSNSFACLPEDVPYRPLTRTQRPQIPGTQTAIVVGPDPAAEQESEEIHTDQYGRVRILFHWNRHLASDRKDLCWARVQQSLAGPNFGAQFLPRVGQEVVVSFLEGDPDRPLVIGCLYNGRNMPPYDLPANKTQSGWKTRSSKEGTGETANEIRFEDKKGSEELYIQAEKDYSTEIKNDETRHVGNNQEITVDADRTLHVKGSNTVTVDGDVSETVTGGVQQQVTGGIDQTVQQGVKVTTPQRFEVTAQAGTQLVAPGGQTVVDQFWKWQGFEHAYYGNLQISAFLQVSSNFGQRVSIRGWDTRTTMFKVDSVGFLRQIKGLESYKTGTSLGQKVAHIVTAGMYVIK